MRTTNNSAKTCYVKFILCSFVDWIPINNHTHSPLSGPHWNAFCLRFRFRIKTVNNSHKRIYRTENIESKENDESCQDRLPLLINPRACQLNRSKAFSSNENRNIKPNICQLWPIKTVNKNVKLSMNSLRSIGTRAATTFRRWWNNSHCCWLLLSLPYATCIHNKTINTHTHTPKLTQPHVWCEMTGPGHKSFRAEYTVFLFNRHWHPNSCYTWMHASARHFASTVYTLHTSVGWWCLHQIDPINLSN